MITLSASYGLFLSSSTSQKNLRSFDENWRNTSLIHTRWVEAIPLGIIGLKNNLDHWWKMHLIFFVHIAYQNYKFGYRKLQNSDIQDDYQYSMFIVYLYVHTWFCVPLLEISQLILQCITGIASKKFNSFQIAIIKVQHLFETAS